MLSIRSARSISPWVLRVVIIMVCASVSAPRLFSQALATGQPKFLGCIHSGSTPAANWSTYFNQVTPENAGKWGNVEAIRNSYNWTSLDAAYNFAKSKGIPFKMHTLVWGQQYPAWITALSQADQAAEVEEWIRLVGARYPDIDLVDVVNECLTGHAPAPADGRCVPRLRVRLQLSRSTATSIKAEDSSPQTEPATGTRRSRSTKVERSL
jgi:GH35 family endo-1,4-beta-xylanase